MLSAKGLLRVRQIAVFREFREGSGRVWILRECLAFLAVKAVGGTIRGYNY